MSSLGLDRIHLQHVDGLLYDYSDADIVYIAGFVRPKNDILARVAETAPQHVQILVDSPTHMLKMLFESVSESQLHRRLKIVEKTPSVSPYYRQEMLKIQMFEI